MAGEPNLNNPSEQEEMIKAQNESGVYKPLEKNTEGVWCVREGEELIPAKKWKEDMDALYKSEDERQDIK